MTYKHLHLKKCYLYKFIKGHKSIQELRLTSTGI